MRITYGPHALVVIQDRLLDPEWIARTVIWPETAEPDPKHMGRGRAYRRVPERDGRMLRVVYEPTDEGARVVTAFLDRGRRRSP